MPITPRVRSVASSAQAFRPVCWEAPREDSHSTGISEGGGGNTHAARRGDPLPEFRSNVERMRTGPFGIKRVFGPSDDRQVVQNPLATPYSGVVMLHYEIPGHTGTWQGTGWLIGPPGASSATKAVTAGHVVWDRDHVPVGSQDWSRNMKVYQGVHGSGTGQHVANVSRMNAVAEWTGQSGGHNGGRADADFAVIEFDQPVSGHVFQFADFAESDLEAMDVNVVGYPSANDQGGPSRFLGYLVWHLGQITDATGSTGSAPHSLFYRMDTEGGQSGCPLIYWEQGSTDYWVVGVHSGFGQYSAGPYNHAVRITGPVFQQLLAWR